jgi:hypothetical protein
MSTAPTPCRACSHAFAEWWTLLASSEWSAGTKTGDSINFQMIGTRESPRKLFKVVVFDGNLRGGGTACRVAHGGFKRGAQSSPLEWSRRLRHHAERRGVAKGRLRRKLRHLTFTTRTDCMIELMSGRVHDMQPPPQWGFLEPRQLPLRGWC